MSVNSLKPQQGVTLIVSLIILLALTMLGITSMKGTTTEIAMAGNLRESALSFQAAEAGLNQAEAILAAGNDPVGMLGANAPDPNYFLNTSWSNATVASLSLAGISISTNPRYIVKFLGTWDPDKNVSSLDPGFSGYGLISSAKTIRYYRATARGYGVSRKTFRTVQSFYGRQ